MLVCGTVVLYRSMANLEAGLAVKEQNMAAARQATQSKKVRLVADPAISVNSLSIMFRQFLEFRKTDDLWSLVSPPADWASELPPGHSSVWRLADEGGRIAF